MYDKITMIAASLTTAIVRLYTVLFIDTVCGKGFSGETILCRDYYRSHTDYFYMMVGFFTGITHIIVWINFVYAMVSFIDSAARLLGRLDGRVTVGTLGYVPNVHLQNAVYNKMVYGLRDMWQTAYIRMLILRFKLSNLVNKNVFTMDQDQVTSLLNMYMQRSETDYRKTLLPFGKQFEVFMANKQHSHPRSASYRSAMNKYLTECALNAGLVPHHLSSARDDFGKKIRQYYGIKDFIIPPENDKIDHNSCIIMTDVDYWANMHEWLMVGRPILMYTFCPDKPAGRREEYCWDIDERGILRYIVSGGAEYEHRMWDYRGDTIMQTAYNGKVHIYNVEQRKVPGDEEHRMIMLTPTCILPKAIAGLVKLIDPDAKRLHRRKTNDTYDPITNMIHIRTGEFNSVSIPYDLMEALRIRLITKTNACIADVQRVLRDLNGQNDNKDHFIDATMIYRYIMENRAGTIRNAVQTSTLDCYQPIVKGCLSTEDGKPMGRAATAPMAYPGACFPTNSEASDLATIKGRVQKPQNNKRPPRHYNQWANDFITSIVSNMSGKIMPITIDEVALEQNKPMQKARTAKVIDTMTLTPKNVISAFVKAEPYAAPNDPRNISSCSTECTLFMSTYTIPIKRSILKRTRWYSPGMTPQEIAERVCEITTRLGVYLTDFARFDGSISKWLRDMVVKAFYQRALNKAHVQDYNKWFDAVYTRTAFTKNGVKYDPGHGTRSGSPLTTDKNTLINAFVAYCACRVLGLNAKQAYKMLDQMLFCGDDGYIPIQKLHPGLGQAMKIVASELGLGLEIEEKRDAPFNFCGRYFVDPLTTTTSYQDPIRTIPKQHLVREGPESIEQRLYNKCAGYAVTDAVTPIIGNFARAGMRISGKSETRGLNGEEIYKLSNAWPQDPGDLECMQMQIAELLDCSVSDVLDYCDLLDRAESLDSLPIIMETGAAKIACIRDGLVERGPHILKPEFENLKNNEQPRRNARISETAPPPSQDPAREDERPSTSDSGRDSTPEPTKSDSGISEVVPDGGNCIQRRHQPISPQKKKVRGKIRGSRPGAGGTRHGKDRCISVPTNRCNCRQTTLQ